eukprot:PLAT11653.2.p1 GENE.PLAT11653.2~~PLAT11653.2.p1  ORF type:complete len:493 (-),score=197.93 PLAT11653.2:153-1631(-)
MLTGARRRKTRKSRAGKAAKADAATLALRAQVDEAERRASEQAAVVAHLRGRLQASEEEVARLNAALKSAAAAQQTELSVLTAESQSKIEKYEHTVRVLEETLRRTQAELSGFALYDSERARLREALEAKEAALSSAEEEHGQVVHRLKRELYRLRRQLEQTFRKSLQGMEEKYRHAAMQQMNEDGKRAVLEAARLRKEMIAQSRGIEGLLTRHRTAEEALREERRERQLLQKSAAMQAEQLVTLKAALHDAQARLATMRSSVRQQHRLRLLSSDKAALPPSTAASSDRGTPAAAAEVSRLRELLAKERKRADRWKARAFKLSRRLLADKGGLLPPMPAEATPGAHAAMPMDAAAARAAAAVDEDASLDDLAAVDGYNELLAIWSSGFPGRAAAAGPASAAVATHGAGGRGDKMASSAALMRSSASAPALRPVIGMEPRGDTASHSTSTALLPGLRHDVASKEVMQLVSKPISSFAADSGHSSSRRVPSGFK